MIRAYFLSSSSVRYWTNSSTNTSKRTGDTEHVSGSGGKNGSTQLQGAQLSRCDLWVSTVPGHKDAEVASAIARELCLTTGEPVSVTVGIHVDSVSLDEITVLGANALAAARAALDGLT
jgi:hypothetical protein